MQFNIPPPPSTDDITGPSWRIWFYRLVQALANFVVDLASGVTGILGVANGGTGTSQIPTDGQILIGNGTQYVPNNITAGSNITITNGVGTITIAATGGGGSGKIYEPVVSAASEFMFAANGDILMAWGGDYAA